jgi:hypothetical protein
MDWKKRAKLLLALCGGGAAVGIPFYLMTHPYAPKSFAQLTLGIAGSVIMISGAGFYALRKRVKRLRSFGQMKHWLNFHILFCLLGPLLIAYHSALTVKAPNSGVAFYAMLVVVASGVVGRYIYRHFQFTLSGERATLREMCEEIGQLDEKLRARFSDSHTITDMIRRFFELRERQKQGGLLRSFYTMVRLDWLERRLRRRVRIFLRPGRFRPAAPSPITPGSIEDLLMKRISLEKKTSALEVTAKLFSYWHQFHVPLIWILGLTFLIHIAAVLIF